MVVMIRLPSPPNPVDPTDPEHILVGRQIRLGEWVNDHYGGKQSAFIAEAKVNQGMVSAMLGGKKSFGERAAATLERKAKMPPGHLVHPFSLSASGAAKRAPAVTPDSVRKLSDLLEAHTLLFRAMLTTISEKQPALGEALGASLGALAGRSGTQRSELEVARIAVAAGLESAAQAAPRRAHPGSSGKQSRTGR